jgi:hypothetical protein
MAGGAAADPPPVWLVLATLAVFMGFVLAYGDTLPSVGVSTFACDAGSLYLNCVSSAVTTVTNILVLLFIVLTLGGAHSPLPILLQGPLVFFFSITWGIIITKMITNTAGAVIP